MYRCTDCGHIFEEGEFKNWTEPHGEKMQGCPKCFSPFEEVEPCKICGSYNHNSENNFCDKCKKTVAKRFSEFIKNNFTKEERELLNELYDGKNI